MTISKEQAGKLKELILKARKAQDWAHGAAELGTPQQARDALQQMLGAIAELDAFVDEITEE